MEAQLSRACRAPEAAGGFIMKRLAWMLLVGILGMSVPALADDPGPYPGPGDPLAYDQTVNGIRVVMTVQPIVLKGGKARFTLRASVPIVADTIGKNITLQIRRYVSSVSFQVLDGCTVSPPPGSQGSTIDFTCSAEMFVQLPIGLPGANLEVYPYVQRPGNTAGTTLEHNDPSLRIAVPIGTDDTYEENDDLVASANLGTPSGDTPVFLKNLVFGQDPLTLVPDLDYYKFTVPPGGGAAEITIQFYNQTGDFDLWIYDSLGEVLAASLSSTEDFENVNLAVAPGQTYYIGVEPGGDVSPAFYDLTLKITAPDIVTITAGPGGTPNPVASGGLVQLSVSATDSLGHELSYFWTQFCNDQLSGIGVFSDRTLRNPTWTAPVNNSGSPRTCLIRVVVSDGRGNEENVSFSQTVGLAGDSLTITEGPSGTPNPVTPPAPVSLTVTAVDALGHQLDYLWTATCPTLGNATGSFSPSAAVRTPQWTPPANLTGSSRTCTLTVAVDDRQGLSTTSGFSMTVLPSVDAVTFTTLPSGTPNPVASSGAVSVNAAAADSYGHALTYEWSAVCSTLGSSGSFSGGTTAARTWTAPANASGTQQSCTLTVVARDAGGVSASASYTQNVATLVHSVTITAGPTGNPNPVASGGTANLSVTASDSLGHGLSYQWSSACPNLGGNGTFTNEATATPTWAAPANLTGAEQTCTITLIASDGQPNDPKSASASYLQRVSSVEHTLTITQGPGSSLNPVATSGTTNLSVTATDSLNHGITYLWSAACPAALGSNGNFTPGATAQNPQWTAPPNTTGGPQDCTIQVTASDNAGKSALGSLTQTVLSAGHTLTVSVPTGAPNPVGGGGVVGLSVTAIDSLNHPLTYQWSASCAAPLGSNGSFSSPTAVAPTWTAPGNATATTQTCTIQVNVSDNQGESRTTSYTQSVSGGAHTITITGPPAGTPNPVASGGEVALTVTAVDNLGHTLSYAWTATCPGLGSPGTFTPSPAVAAPTWTAPVNGTPGVQGCTIAVVVSDAFGQSANASFTQSVNTSVHSLTLVTPPAGTPNPSTAGAPVAVAATVVDSFGHPLTYLWQSTCVEVSGAGTFSPSASVAAPTWTPPANPPGTDLTCLISLNVIDTVGSSVSGSFVQKVLASGQSHTVTITTPPAGTPNPVASGGAATLSVAATDSQGHALTYQWSATCPTLGGNGTFSPSAATQNPSWTAPANQTGSTQACTLQVMANDNQGQTATASYTQNVSSVAHTVTITAGPTGTPNPVASGGSVTLSVTAADSLNHPLTYQWQSSCSGTGGNGTFTPNATAPSPTFVAPANAAAAEVICTVQVTAKDSGGLSAVKSYSQRVSGTAPPHTLTITVPPAGSPNPVPSGGTVSMTVTAVDSLGHSLTYAWQATCPGQSSNGTFAPAASAPSPTWTAPSGVTSVASCSVEVTVSDGEGANASASFAQTVTPPTHTLTLTVPPAGTPNPSSAGAPVALSVTAADSFGHPLTYLWQASCAEVSGTGTFSPSASVVNPTWTPPASTGNLTCLMRVTVIDNVGSSATGTFVQTVSSGPAHTVTITTPPAGAPNPVASASTTSLSVAATDSLGHGLTYQWSASCPTLSGNGTFLPSALTQNPQWTAPGNGTGSTQSCTVSVTASDGLGQSANASFSQAVTSAPHSVTIVTPPAGTPNPVGSGGTTSLSVAATDSLGHSVAYQWSAACAQALGNNGTFLPSPLVQSPTWTAPVNTGTTEQNCAISVIARDDFGESGNATYTQRVSPAGPTPHTVTITSGPSGSPNPVASGATALLNATAVDSLGHTVNYRWTASCPALPNNGGFSPGADVQSPTWTAPANSTSVPQSCTIQVVASDGLGESANASFSMGVNSVATTHTLTLTSPPAGTPNPSPAGAPVSLRVTAVDSLGHTLSYLWQATCAEVEEDGTFVPGANAAAPTWTPPAHPNGAPLSCLIRVSIFDGVDKSLNASFLQKVDGTGTPAHTLTITTSPSGTPDPVQSAGATLLSVEATDSLGHPLTYVWVATCPTLNGNGTFTPAPTGPSPTWTAPQNLTGAQQVCTIQVTVSDGFGETVAASFAQRVSTVPHTLSITSPPAGTPNPVAAGTAAALTVTATDSLNHTISYLWQASCAGLGASGVFLPSATVRTPTWTPPTHPEGLAFTCAMSVVADDGEGKSVQGSYQQNVLAGTAPAHTLTIAVPPNGTPNPVASGASATLSVTAVDSLGHPLFYTWTASCPALPGNGTFAPNANAAAPTWTAPANPTGVAQACSVQVAVTDNQGLTQNATYHAERLRDGRPHADHRGPAGRVAEPGRLRRDGRADGHRAGLAEPHALLPVAGDVRRCGGLRHVRAQRVGGRAHLERAAEPDGRPAPVPDQGHRLGRLRGVCHRAVFPVRLDGFAHVDHHVARQRHAELGRFRRGGAVERRGRRLPGARPDVRLGGGVPGARGRRRVRARRERAAADLVRAVQLHGRREDVHADGHRHRRVRPVGCFQLHADRKRRHDPDHHPG